MCDTCGCGQPGEKTLIRFPGEEEANSHEHGHEHAHEHTHTHEHGHEHGHEHTHTHEHPHDHGYEHTHEHGITELKVEEDILGKNNLMAERNRGYFEAREIMAFNWVSSPGSGKTTLLEQTIARLADRRKFYLIEGDQQSMLDAERIDKTGVPVIQVNTGSGCHLDARMIHEAMIRLKVENGAFLMIENVGNLVCPALFDLGEQYRIVTVSVTEGDDKPLKYPDMFRTSDICIINKIDLLPHLDSDPGRIREYALRVNHHLEFFELSARTGEGMEKWIEWLAGL
jgi:hydrogenase nickel incorporation protein HypB